jgi:hypothetical protein
MQIQEIGYVDREGFKESRTKKKADLSIQRYFPSQEWWFIPVIPTL